MYRKISNSFNNQLLFFLNHSTVLSYPVPLNSITHAMRWYRPPQKNMLELSETSSREAKTLRTSPYPAFPPCDINRD